MQLDAPNRASSIRGTLGTAACMLLASAAPALAQTESGAVTQIDGTLLLYGEESRANVTEPTVRVTRLYPSGRALSGQIALDVITGASPSGAMPSGVASPAGGGEEDDAPRVQTVTAASGGAGGGESSPSDIPLATFQDTRFAFDGDWTEPLGRLLRSTLGAHFSREKDYQSIGVSAKCSMDMMQRLTTVTIGGGYNQDLVFPVGGTRVPLSDSTVVVGTDPNSKHVGGGLVGVSRILTRRWMISVTGSRNVERGYLTEPYKVVSLLDPITGIPSGELTENRPSTRTRSDFLTSTVYHLARDVVYLSHRYYWDDWGVRSNTGDLKYRRELSGGSYLEPHLRYYSQTAADFFSFGLVAGQPIPAYVTSDYRLGPLKSATIGATYGFHLPNDPGEFSIRAEYIRQFGDGHPSDAVGVQAGFDLMPPVNIGSLVAAYTVSF